MPQWGLNAHAVGLWHVMVLAGYTSTKLLWKRKTTTTQSRELCTCSTARVVSVHRVCSLVTSMTVSYGTIFVWALRFAVTVTCGATVVLSYLLVKFRGLKYLLLSILSHLLYKNVLRHLPPQCLGARSMRLRRWGRKMYARATGLPENNLSLVRQRNCPCSIHSQTLSDTIVLKGTLLSPAGREFEALPVILIRTPYRRQNALRLGWVYAERGYHVLVQDTRGRFGSTGEFFPVANEIEDGRATVQWIKEQPFCNGRVGSFGISYLGLTSWAAGSPSDVTNRSGLSAIVPVMASSRLFPIFKGPNGGGLSLDLGLRWLYIVLNLQTHSSFPEFVYRLLVSAPQLDSALMHTPLREADAMVTGNGENVEFFQQALVNLTGNEAFWHNKDTLYDLHRYPSPPVHIICGWYDFFLEQQLQDFSAAIATGSVARLTIGAFAHWDLHRYSPLAHRHALTWFDRHLKGMKSFGGELPVHVFVMGGNPGWSQFTHWPPREGRATVWYFGPYGKLELSPPRENGSEEYTYNPRSPTPYVGGPSFNPVNSGPMDQHSFEARDDVLVYTSSVLSRAIRIVGQVNATIYVKSSIPQLDIVCRLCDVDPGGKSTNICDGMQRIGNSVPGALCKFAFSAGNTAYEFRAGHRIRIQVCSGAHPRWMRNYGTDESVATATRMIGSRVKVFTGNAHASRISFPYLNSEHSARTVYESSLK